AVRKRYATPLEVYNGLRQQRDEAARGEHRPLGEVLLDAGPLTPWELEDVLLTLADLASGSTRSGETPSDAIALDPTFRSTGPSAETARSFPRAIATRAVKTTARP